MAKIVRRAAQKVLNSRDGHGLLGLLIFEEKLVYENFQKMVNTKANASISMLKWAKNEENLALQDAFSKVFEVSSMWDAVMRDFNEEHLKYRKAFKEVLHREKCLDEARRREALQTSKLNKLQKQLDQSKRKSDVGRPRTISNEMEEVLSQAEQEQAELEVKSTKHEIFKALKLRSALIQISDGLHQWASKTLLVAEALKKIANVIPDTPTQLTPSKVFHGAGLSRGIVNDLAKDLHIDPDFSAELAAMAQSTQPYLYAVSAPIKEAGAKYCYVDLNAEHVDAPIKPHARRNKKGARAPQPLPRHNPQAKENSLEDQNFRRPLSLNDLRPPPTSPPPPLPKSAVLQGFERTSSASITSKEKVSAKVSAPVGPSHLMRPKGKLWYARTSRLSSSDSGSDGYTEPLPADTVGMFSYEQKKVVVSRVLSDGALNEPYASRELISRTKDLTYYHKLERHKSAEDACSEESEIATYVDLIN